MKFAVKSILIIAILGAIGCYLVGCKTIKVSNPDSHPVSHQIWDEQLHQYVNDQGEVDYANWVKDSSRLNEYLHLLEQNAPNSRHWTSQQRLAYWINAYNAYTIQIVLRHYPVNSIKDIATGLNIPFVSTVWDIKFIHIAGKDLDLNNLEHSVLRKQFDEPRIHFAIVCASKSCPYLRNEAYDDAIIEQQLDDQARRFINDGLRNIVTSKSVQLSKIFKWYGGDFTKKTGLTEYLNKYSNVQISNDATIEYLEYDWSLNE